LDVLKGDIPDTLLFVKIKGIYSVQAKAVCVRTMLKRTKKKVLTQKMGLCYNELRFLPFELGDGKEFS